ncbi:MAG: SBBP repeat-containing protein [Acidobacteriota bacterium]|nr:SBBP repeat-containing protein [Acidobacteriota bacterium]
MVLKLLFSQLAKNRARLALPLIAAIGIIWLASPRLLVNGGQSAQITETSALTDKRMAENLAHLPLSFEANLGQTGKQTKFIARGLGYQFGLGADEAVMVLQPGDLKTSKQKSTAIRMKLVGANALANVTGIDRLPTKSNYLIGNDPNGWRTDVPHFAKVRYETIYPGIDLVYYGNQQELEYDFIVNPGTNANAIKLRFDGIKNLRLDDNGDLLLNTSGGTIRQKAPFVYQQINDNRRQISGRYVIEGETVGFEIGEYDRCLPLVIDPVISYATYLGGASTASLFFMKHDKDANIILSGYVTSAGFPTTPGAFQPTLNNTERLFDGCVMKLNPAGTEILFATYFGGSGTEFVSDMDVDDQGNIYLAGSSQSANFPIKNGFQANLPSDIQSAFVAKLNPQGSQLLYSTFYLASSHRARSIGQGIVVSGNIAYVAGNATLADDASGERKNTFLLVVDTGKNGSASKLYDRDFRDCTTRAIKLDAAGKVVLSGYALAPFVRTLPPVGPTEKAMYIAKVDTSLPPQNSLIYSATVGVNSTFPANSTVDPISVSGLGFDEDDNIYVAGAVTGTIQTTANAFQTQAPVSVGNARNSGYLMKFSPAGSLLYSSYFGGTLRVALSQLAVIAKDKIYFTGNTQTADMPVTADALQLNLNGSQDALLAMMDLSKAGNAALIYSTYLGGSGAEAGFNLVKDNAGGNLFLLGSAPTTDFPITPNALQPTRLNPSNGFLAKISGAFTPVPTALAAMNVSAASYSGSTLSPESIVAVFGSKLANATQIAGGSPLPTELAGSRVRVRDSLGVERMASLFFVSPTQINYLLPAGTAAGQAEIMITNDAGELSMERLQIAGVVPGVFTADASGRGVAAATVLRIRANGERSFESVVQYDGSQNRLVPLPIDLGAETDQVFLLLFGTGFRNRSSLSNTVTTIGGVGASVSFAGAQGDFSGLDQINALLPRNLIGRGEVDVTLMVDGKTANTVRINIK